jgi:cell division protein FtsQ
LTPPLVRPAAAPGVRAPARPRADPRIVARRVAVRRSEGRRRLRRLLWCVGVVAVVGLGLGATRTALLDVDRVEVDGAERVPVELVLDAARTGGASAGVPLTDVDEKGIERAVERLPGVAHADVGRSWRGTLTVAIIERTPVATLTEGHVTAVVAADGVVTALVPSPPPGLPVLAGTDVDLEPGAVVDAPDLLAVAAALPPEVAAAVSAVASAHRGEVELVLGDGGVARLGPAVEIGAKLVAVATVLEQVDLTCLATLDVRVPSAPAVTRTPGCSS